MDWLLFGLSLFGLVLAIVGYLLDHVAHFPWLMEKLAPQYAKGTHALDDLAEHEHNVITPAHRGFPVLLQRWPTPHEKERVALIGRGPAYMNLLHNIKHDIQLFLVDEHHEDIVGEPWRYTEARAALSEEMNRRIFKIGSTTFFIGIAVSLLSALASLVISLLSTS